nr:endo alpha-1,4 polygalactosaminidase [Actinoalloteichus hoggarensis]
MDVSTPEKRADAVEHPRPVIETCTTKGFSAVEYDNPDSWIRFDGTPLEGQVPFDEEEAVAFATLLTEVAHSLDLASAQKTPSSCPPRSLANGASTSPSPSTAVAGANVRVTGRSTATT